MPRDRIGDEALARLMAEVFRRRQERAVLTGATSAAGGTGEPPLTNPMTAQGDLIRGGESGAPVRLPVGADGQVLTVTNGLPAWQNAPTAYPGDEYIQDVVAALLQAGNNITLTYNDAANTLTISAATGGMTNPMTTPGDMVVGGSGGTPQRLGIGTDGQVLTVVSGMPAWGAPSGGGGGSISAGPIGSRPAPGTAGRLYLCTDTPLICYDNGAAWLCWGSADFPIAEPDNNAFTWAAQGYLNGAQIDTSKGGILLTTLRAPANSWAIRVMNAPTPPFTVTARMRPVLIGRTAQQVALIARNSATGDFVTVELEARQSASTSTPAQRIRMAKWTNETTYNSEYDGGIQPWAIDRPLWFRYRDTGTYREGYFSYDGIWWHKIPVTNVSRTDFTEPDQIGFGVNGSNNNVGTDPAVWLLGWEVTT